MIYLRVARFVGALLHGFAPGAGFTGAGLATRSAGVIGFGVVTVAGGALAGAFVWYLFRVITPESMVLPRSEMV